MITLSPATKTMSQTALRFGIRDLLVALATVSVTLAAGCGGVALGVAVSLAWLGIWAVVAGRRGNRSRVWAVGILLIAGAAVYIAIQSISVAWCGSRELDVHVIVVDASHLTPIPNATIELLTGPPSPLEHPPLDIDRAFDVVPSGNPNGLTTNNRGYAQFSHRFFAAGRYGLLEEESGYIETRWVWLRVTCPGYVTTYMPIDQQSPSPRDIKNSTPIWVTVPLGKD